MTVHFGLIKITTHGKPQADLPEMDNKLLDTLGEQFQVSSHWSPDLMEDTYYTNFGTVNAEKKRQEIANISHQKSGLLRTKRTAIYLDDTAMAAAKPGSVTTIINQITDQLENMGQKFSVRFNAPGTLEDNHRPGPGPFSRLMTRVFRGSFDN